MTAPTRPAPPAEPRAGREAAIDAFAEILVRGAANWWRDRTSQGDHDPERQPDRQKGKA